MTMANIAEFLDGVEHFPMLEDTVSVLVNRIRNEDPTFFRNIVAYHMGLCAATMRTTVKSDILATPTVVNIYNIALGSSGVGKGFSMHLMEDVITAGFRQRFIKNTMPHLAKQNIAALAANRAVNNETSEEDETALLQRQYKKLGNYQFTFDGGHESAIKDLRNRIIIANCGALNLQVDEIGSNLEKSSDPMKVYLELYDNGKIKSKLLKNSAENERFEELDGQTPSNAIFFGAPDELFAGGNLERTFLNFLRIGFARRSLFALALERTHADTFNPSALYYQLHKSANTFMHSPIIDKFTRLADADKLNWAVHMPRECGELHLTYEHICKTRAKEIKKTAGDNILMFNMEHRQSVVLKIAGAFAFMDETNTMHPSHYKAAVKLVEESGDALKRIVHREMPHQRLAKYIAKASGDLTLAELREQLPYFPHTQSGVNDIMTTAIAYGYKNNIIIKKSYQDAVEFYSADTLEETNLDELTVSYSKQFAENYKHDVAPFSKMEILAKAPNMHWCNHKFQDNYRGKANVLPGCNMVVLDVDTNASIEVVQEVLGDYHHLIYTTKSHTDLAPRFRVMLPLNYNIELSREDYVQFVNNIMDWLPFEVDDGSAQPERKWRTNPHGKVYTNSSEESVLFDVLPFLPRTARNAEHVKEQQSLKSMESLERWFAQKWGEGNRNKLMHRFAMCLSDSGKSFPEVEKRVLAFNKSLPSSLSVDELQSTVFKSLAKKMNQAA